MNCLPTSFQVPALRICKRFSFNKVRSNFSLKKGWCFWLMIAYSRPDSHRQGCILSTQKCHWTIPFLQHAHQHSDWGHAQFWLVAHIGHVSQSHQGDWQQFICPFPQFTNIIVGTVSLVSNCLKRHNIFFFAETKSVSSTLMRSKAWIYFDHSNLGKWFHKVLSNFILIFSILSYNRLTFLQPETFIPLISLHSIYLEGNMWNCNCRMQPFKRMLLLRSMLNVLDQPRCISNHSAVWSNLALENFQCPPQIMKNFSEPEVTVSEGSPLRLKCAIVIETFGDQRLDEEYLASSSIEWYWNQVLITNNSKGCENCKNFSPDDNGKHFVIQEYVREYNRNHKVSLFEGVHE